jgi:hypothetical protein
MTGVAVNGPAVLAAADLSTTGADLTAFGTDPWWLVLAKVLAVFVFLVVTVLAAPTASAPVGSCRAWPTA